jgi:hypothetical protein
MYVNTDSVVASSPRIPSSITAVKSCAGDEWSVLSTTSVTSSTIKGLLGVDINERIMLGAKKSTIDGGRSSSHCHGYRRHRHDCHRRAQSLGTMPLVLRPSCDVCLSCIHGKTE